MASRDSRDSREFGSDADRPDSRGAEASQRSARRARRERPAGSSVPFVVRPFEGLAGETDWVALREIVPAATAELTLASPAPTASPVDSSADDDAARSRVAVATVLPMAWPGMRRPDGEVVIGLQSAGSSGDTSRDLAAVLLSALDAEPGAAVSAVPPVTADSPRLQDLLDPAAAFPVTVHDGFDFWLGDAGALDGEDAAAMEQANATVIPTVRLTGVTSAYWCRIGARTHLRWVLPQNEDAATDALARLHAAGASSLGTSSRLLGAFRACGLLVPVWDLDPDLDADDYEGPVAELAARLQDALASGSDLSGDERRARAGLLTRQITLR